MSNDTLQLIKDISSNMTIILAAIMGGVITIITAVVQARYKFKEVRYQNEVVAKQQAIKQYFLNLYEYIEVGVFSDTERQNKIYADLKISEAVLIPFLNKYECEQVLEITFKAKTRSIFSSSDRRITSLLHDLKYHQSRLQKVIYFFYNGINRKNNSKPQNKTSQP